MKRKMTRQQQKAMFAKQNKYKYQKDYPVAEKEPMPIRATITVPSTNGDGTKPISKEEMNKRVKETELFMANNFGGETAIKGDGAWSDGKKLFKDDVVVVESYSTREDWEKNDTKLRSYALRKQKAWEQECVAVTFEDLERHEKREGMHFESKDKYKK